MSTKLTEKTEYKTGYKKTKLGWIPEDWEVVKIKNITSLVKDGTHGTHENVENGIPLLSAKDITDNKIILDDEPRLISQEDYEKIHRNYSLKVNDILLTIVGTIGRCCILKNINTAFTLQRSVAIIRVNENPYFINQLFKSKYFQRQLELRSNSSAQAGIYLGELNKILIPIPPLPEQAKIAEVLTSWDNAIEKTEKLIEFRQKSKKAFMQSLLTGKLRFPQFAGHERKIVKLKDYLNERSIKNNKNQVQNVLSVTNSRGFINQDEQFERSVASKDLKGYKIVKKGQFAYNPSRINVGSIDLLKTFDTGIVSPIYVIFETKEDKLLSEYLKHFFKTYNFFEQMKAFTQGGVRDSLSFKGLSMMKMFIPSIEEQKKIVAVLNSCDREIEILKQKLNKLNEQKKGLMQKLLTGQVRVKV